MEAAERRPEAIGRVKAHLVFAFGDDVVNPGVGSHVFDCGGSLFRIAGRAGHQQVKIARGLASPAERPGRCNTLDAFEFKQIGCNLLGRF